MMTSSYNTCYKICCRSNLYGIFLVEIYAFFTASYRKFKASIEKWLTANTVQTFLNHLPKFRVSSSKFKIQKGVPQKWRFWPPKLRISFIRRLIIFWSLLLFICPRTRFWLYSPVFIHVCTHLIQLTYILQFLV